MRTAMRDLDAERVAMIAKSRTILDGAKAAGRDLTPSEAKTVESHLDEVNGLNAQIKGRALVTSVMSLGSSETDYSGDGGGSIFTAEAKSAIVRAVQTRTPYRTELVGTKAALTGALLPTSGTGVEPGLHPNSQFPLASLFSNMAASGPSQRYYRTTAGTAAVVAEGALKPDAGIAFTAVDVLLQKLACTAQFTDEMQEDGPFLLGFLQAEMIAAIAAAENALILSTFTGTSGVLSSTGTTATVVDLVADAIGAQESISGVTPSAIITTPTTVAAIRKSKASTSGVYNTDILSASPTSLHGVKLVSSPAVAAGVAWVVCRNGTSIFRRGSVTFEVGHNATDWVTNTQTARAEERIAVGVTRPTSLSKITLT